MNRALRRICAIAVLAAGSGGTGGCADTYVAATNAGSIAQAANDSNQAPRPVPHQTAYGLSSDGPTTDLYTELFRSRPREQPASVAPASVTAGTGQQDQGAVASNVTVKDPATAQDNPASATVYGLSSDGTTTDLYTELFGRRSRE